MGNHSFIRQSHFKRKGREKVFLTGEDCNWIEPRKMPWLLYIHSHAECHYINIIRKNGYLFREGYQ